MAQITNPDVIRFCNENVRRMADWVTTLNNFSTGAQTQLAQLQSAGLVNNSSVIGDGAGVAGDARMTITGAQVLTFLSVLNTFFTTHAAFMTAVAQCSVNNFQPDFSDLSWNQGS